MIRSTNQELGEYDLVREPGHIAKVWAVVEAALPKYWEKFVDAERQDSTAGKLAAKFGVTAAKEGAVAAKAFEKAIALAPAHDEARSNLAALAAKRPAATP